jgi:tetratricopeptide (TPR) repeat protein
MRSSSRGLFRLVTAGEANGRRDENTERDVVRGEKYGTEAEELLAELLGLPPERRLRRLEHGRFKSDGLLELLLDRSRASQPSDTVEAVTLADLALRLAEILGERYASARALSLRGNAFRLRGNFEKADRAFAQAALFLDDESPERAFFSRALAILRWEENRMDEALALLNHAASLFHRDGFEAEEATTLILAGLAQFETESPLFAFGPLHWGFMHAYPTKRNRWLLWRAGFALSSCAAESGEHLIGLDALIRTLELRTDSTRTQEETARYQRYYGRALFALRDYSAAWGCLDLACGLYLDERRVPELGLACLDLGALLARARRLGRFVSIVRDIQGLHLLPEPERTIVLEALQRFADDISFGGDPQRCRDQAAAELRRRLRAQKIRVEPIPFA